MKRPNQYSKPLEGVRTENYHPADLNGQYEKDLNKYINYLELKQERSYSEEEVLKILKNYDREFKLDTFAYTKSCTFTVKEWFEQFKKK